MIPVKPVKRQPPSVVADFKRLAKHAATFGFVLAILCHLVPPQYRALCNQLATVCSGGR